jgi:hypothetical protein
MKYHNDFVPLANDFVPLAVMSSLSAAIMVVFAVTVMY